MTATDKKTPEIVEGKKCVLCDRPIGESTLFIRLPVTANGNTMRKLLLIENEDLFVEPSCLRKLGTVFRKLTEMGCEEE